ncbi:MAG: thiamine phosphate synthase [Gammaproteobacteria bacterium]|nr:thiamine phosphate synthase [Gammaproteobacteria bacterium]
MTVPYSRRRLFGLYGITDEGPGLTRRVEQALQGGVSMIQYRDKTRTKAQREYQALELLGLCHRFGVPVIINDDLDLAISIGADGVHLGQNDPDPQTARQLLGPDSIIGVSCYNRFQLAADAQRKDADYVAFGSFFPSGTKPGAVRADIALLRRAAEELRIPAVAIGGITPENGGALIRAGAAMLAVIQGLFGQSDIGAACSRFNQLFASIKELQP